MAENHTLAAFMSLILRPVSPLHGGGFFVAFAQICTFYYIAACALHFVLPSLVKVENIQPRARKQGEARRDAFFSIGELLQREASLLVGDLVALVDVGLPPREWCVFASCAN